MALHILSTIISRAIPSTYYLPIVVTILFITFIHAYAQGRRTNRDRDLHARTVVLTGAFTPLGLTLLEFLAKRGAHIIALVPTPSLTSRHAEILSLIRDTTANESIYAEPCPLDSPAQIKKFCERFVNIEHEKDRRIDALIMAHEYAHIGTWNAGSKHLAATREEEILKRDEAAMATFLFTTLLLPTLLVAPVERDIRIINIINPFYAAAVPAFNPRLSSLTYNPLKLTKFDTHTKLGAAAARDSVQPSKWSLEGQRALRSAVFVRHLQRILDALPEPGSAAPSSPANASGSNAKTPLKLKQQPSNIMAVTVTPGICRTDTVAPYLFSFPSGHRPSAAREWAVALFYIILQPFLWIFTKSPTSAVQSVLHVLCVPKPVTRRHLPQAEDVAQAPPRFQPPASIGKQAEEVLVPGALYADCAVIKLSLRVAQGAAPPQMVVGEEKEEGDTDGETTRALELGLGNEPLGRAVWEALEEGAKIWEAKEKQKAH